MSVPGTDSKQSVPSEGERTKSQTIKATQKQACANLHVQTMKACEYIERRPIAWIC